MEPETAALWSTFIAVLSLSVSLFLLWRQHSSAGRAHFTAEWADPDYVVFVNRGPAGATNVNAVLTGSVVQMNSDTPIPYIGPFQATRVRSIRAYGSPIGTLRITWRDSRWRPQELDIHLSDPPAGPQPSTSRDAVEKAVRAIAREESQRAITEQGRDIFRQGGF